MQSAKSHSRVYNDKYKNAPWCARNFWQGKANTHQETGHTHILYTYICLLDKQVEGVHWGCAKSIFNAGWNLHVHVGVCVGGCFHVRVKFFHFFFYCSESVFNIFVHTFTRICSSECVYMWHTTVLSAWLNIFPVHSPLLFLPLLPHPPCAAWLARTCMSVDSVLCSLPWHAPTSLQCSPVCINWQRDSGFVVCRMGRVEKMERGGGALGSKRQRKDTIVTITVGRTDWQAVWQVSQRDPQTNRMCAAECAQGDYLTVCCACA